MCVVVLRMAAGDAVREGEALKLLFNQTHSPWGASVCPGVATSVTLPPEHLPGGHRRSQEVSEVEDGCPARHAVFPAGGRVVAGLVQLSPLAGTDGY